MTPLTADPVHEVPETDTMTMAKVQGLVSGSELRRDSGAWSGRAPGDS